MSKEVPGFLGWTPARYRVRFRVPEGWGHIGLLSARDARGTIYPVGNLPAGRAWETWADAAEVRLAIEHGWRVEVLERLYAVKPEGRSAWARPLRSWAEGLLAIREDVEELSAGDEPLHRAACRNIILHAIGLMAGRNLQETRAVEREGDTWADWADVPEDAIRGTETESGEDILYQSQVRAPRGAFDHPELAHQVWGQCRAWLLSKRQQTAHGSGAMSCDTGALHLPREQVVGFAQDALYTTADPGWPDDGKAGRYRVKGSEPMPGGACPSPRTRAELLALMGGGQDGD
jgi:hypothetical protein